MENFIVSARKYRPSKFLDVVGQEQVSETLKKALSSNKLAQSFLFCGPRGVGKTTCARILAKAINCENPNIDFEPCGECNSCTSFNQNASFNIFELDAASNNSVDDIRNLVDQVRFPPQSGKYKVYIIDEVHMLSASAFNAFLKTLEEPPSYAIFILATTEKHKIIPTILSRCQIFDFKRISDQDIVKQLQKICDKEGVESEPSALHVIAQKADGGMRDALSLFDKIVSYAGKKVTYQDVITNLNILDHDYYFKVTENFMVEDSSSVLNAFNEIINNGFDGEMFLLGLASHFRNLLISKDAKTVALLEAAEDIKEKYFTQANLVNETFLLNALNIINQCDVDYKTAKNKRLHVELTLLKICFLNTQIENTLTLLLGEKKKLTLLLKFYKEKKKQAIDGIQLADESLYFSEIKSNEIIEDAKPSAYTSASTSEKTNENKSAIISKEQNLKSEIINLKSEIKKTKRELPKSSSLGAMFKEIHNEVIVEIDDDKLDLNIENLQALWSRFLEENKTTLQNAFMNVALTQIPELKEDSIVFTLTNNVSLQMLQLHKMDITAYFRKRTTSSNVVPEFLLKKNEKEQKNYKTTKDRLKDMIDDNAAVLKLLEKFELNLD